MTTQENAVANICNEVYRKMPEQILIDLVQEKVEPLLHRDNTDPLRRDDIGAVSYECSILLDVYNPKFEYDIQILKKLIAALDAWCDDLENTNVLLGLPKES